MTLAIGHSHLNSLQKAATIAGFDLDIFNLWLLGPPIVNDGDAPRLHPRIAERLQPLVVSLIGGAAHDLLGLLQHPSPFDFVLPENPDLPLCPDSAILPYAAVTAAVDALIGPDEADLPGLIAATGSRVLHFESPPPCWENPRFAGETVIIAALWQRPSASDQIPSPPWLRYKLWRVHSAIVRRRCEARGIEFVPAPREALGDDGFLLPELYLDPCHANEGYGMLQLRQLTAALESPRVRSSARSL